MNRQRLLVGLAGLVLLASSAVADGYPDNAAGAFGVSIDGKITKLSSSPSTFPLWSGTVVGLSGPSLSSYKYVQLDGAGSPTRAEAFSRTLKDPEAIATENEFFEREVTRSNLPLVPLVYDPWPMSKTKIFDDTQVATIHLTTLGEGGQAQFEGMLQQPVEALPMQVDFRYINHKLLHSVRNISLSISGKSSMEFNKMAFKLRFDSDRVAAPGEKSGFFKRPSIKLRSETSDPTMMREKIYIDVLNAMGVPTQQGAWVRLYLNSKPVGLYLMVDDIGPSFLRQTIHHGDHFQTRGSLWQMNAPLEERQADLAYHGPTSKDYPKDCYKMKTLGSNPPLEPMTQLIQLMKDLADFDVLSTDSVAYWDKRLDLDGFLRNMAMEYLGGSWDAYWWSGSNYFMYFNPAMQKWQWISTDFDGTFGDGDPTDTLTTYQDWAKDMATGEHDRPLVSKLILHNQVIKSRFEAILKEVVSYAFKPEALFPRIDAYEKMLALDIEWEYSIDRSNFPGKTNAWTVKDFHQSIVGPVKDMNLGVKPWIQGRTEGLEQQLGFNVVPGTPDRVKRPVHYPHGGSSDVEVSAASSEGTSATLFVSQTRLSVWATLMALAMAVFW
ncbi:spore coat protein H [Entomortierella parvispora]|uniref:Spore coat protein H n=1 Tax=Entomortierella parvispora TaxID=205924 RepID=A0A9P3H427_9FUNG|nr:spore coat protein H [Entomortierella parvispora]